MEFDRDIVNLELFDAMSSIAFNFSLCLFDTFDFIVQEDFKLQDAHEFYVKLEAFLGENLDLQQEEN